MPQIPSSTNGKLPVCGEDLANLRASGLTDETIRDNELRTEQDPAILAAILNRRAIFDCCLGGLVIPYRNLAGEVNCFARVRPHIPRVRDGEPIKYEQPVGEPLRAYYPKASLTKLRDGESPVYVAEGEKKTLALSQLGLAAVGIGGVWCWKKKGTEQLIDGLAAVGWRNRVAFIVFDYDKKPETRHQTAGAARRLARALRKAGAKEVYVVKLPPGPDGAKQGVDDFLVANGAEAFHKLVEQAEPVPILNDFAPLTKAEGRTDTNNAGRLAARYGDLARWVGPWDKWLIWDGSRWKIDQALAIDLKAKDIAADLFGEIAAILKECKE
jgi:putative DNA primase/helicase